jgi:DHA2 family multidrug resistance protein
MRTSPHPSTGPQGVEEWYARVNPWVIAASVVLATFMEVLDTTIVMVALPHIAGSMAATNSEATWTLTSYLVANGIVVPMSGWLAQKFGRKRLIMICTGLFVTASVVCAVAPNMAVLVIARIFQGFGGGAMVPVAQAVLLESFPPAKRGMAMAMFGLVVVVAPIIGPTFGGWLTDNYTWRWAFYINVPTGLLALFLMARFLEDPPWIKQSRVGRLDLMGFSFLILWVGALQVILDKGQDEDWFSSKLITRLTLIVIIGFIAFIMRELRTPRPMVDLSVFANRNFWTGTFTTAMVMGVMYSSATMLPQFLQTLLGFTAELSGWAIAPRGMGALCIMPLVGYLLSFLDGRKLIMLGLCLFALSNHMLGNLNMEIDIGSLIFANVVQGIAMGLIFVPLMTLAVATLRNEQMGNATGLFNLARNVGGSIGISAVTTYLVRSAQRNQMLLVSHLTPYDAAYRQFLTGSQAALTPLSGAPQARRQAYGIVYGILLQQSTLLAFANTYRWMAVAVVFCIPAVLLMKKAIARGGMTVH